MRSTSLYLVLATAMMSIAVPPKVAGQARAMSLEELSTTSHAIVLGQTVDKRSYWTDDGSKIYTDVRIRVADRLKGDAASETVITVPGGRVGNTLYEVSDMPVFIDGEEVLLFLEAHTSGVMLVTGGMQGKLQIIEDQATGEKMLRTASLQPADALAKAGSIGPEYSRPVPLEDFLTQIRSHVENE